MAVLLELVELPELPELLPELPPLVLLPLVLLPLELPPELLPLVELPEELLPVVDPDVDDDELLVAGPRNITERTSSSIRRKTARARRARSTSACPAVE